MILYLQLQLLCESNSTAVWDTGSTESTDPQNPRRPLLADAGLAPDGIQRVPSTPVRFSSQRIRGIITHYALCKFTYYLALLTFDHRR